MDLHNTNSETTIEIPMDNIQSTCIEDCLECSRVCLEAAMNHCLKSGGNHVSRDHFRLMMDCVEICETATHFQLTESPYANQVCAICAEICEACANSCEKLSGMETCVLICLKTADSCRSVADMKLNAHFA